MNSQNEITNRKNGIILYQPDNSIELEVMVENDTVWLNRNQIATLFDRDIKTIGKHINNALREELAIIPVVANFATTANTPTVAKLATVQMEGDREVLRNIEYYNLDVILSVGYRVKSIEGIRFRAWANTIYFNIVFSLYCDEVLTDDDIEPLGEEVKSRFTGLQILKTEKYEQQNLHIQRRD